MTIQKFRIAPGESVLPPGTYTARAENHFHGKTGDIVTVLSEIQPQRDRTHDDRKYRADIHLATPRNHHCLPFELMTDAEKREHMKLLHFGHGLTRPEHTRFQEHLEEDHRGCHSGCSDRIAVHTHDKPESRAHAISRIKLAAAGLVDRPGADDSEAASIAFWLVGLLAKYGELNAAKIMYYRPKRTLRHRVVHVLNALLNAGVMKSRSTPEAMIYRLAEELPS